MTNLITGQFSDSYLPIADGVANVVKNYAYWLDKKYGCSYVIAPKFPDYEDQENFEVLRYYSVPIPLRQPYRAGAAFLDLSFQKRLKRIDFDLVHTHSPFSSGKLAMKVARDRGIPIVTTFHSKYYDDFKNATKSDTVAQMMVKRIIEFYNSVDYVWTVNKSTVETLREYGYTGNVDVVTNGIDFPVDFPDKGFYPLSGENGSEETGGRLEFLYVGQLVLHKNLRLVINALQLAKNAGLDFHMTLVGEGNARDELEKLIYKLEMEDRFTFTGRINDREKLKSIYARSDLFIFPSVYDTFSLVVREAAATGCPSIVVRNSSAAENIRDGYNGFLCEENEGSLASVLLSSASDSRRLKEVGRTARNTLLRSWASVVDEVEGRYREIIRTHHRIRA